MAGSTISTTVTTTVQLGGSLYPSPLTITRSGIVAPSVYSATGVIAKTADVKLFDSGHVTGGYGDAFGSNGGIGVDLRSGGDGMSNTGSIAGGNANRFTDPSYPAGNGGNGVDIASGRIVNDGTIGGGAGGYGYHFRPGAGGDGVYLSDSFLSNSGTISGGDGGFDNGGLGGDGVDAARGGGTLRNFGSILGGNGGHGGGQGGAGVAMLSGGSLLNVALIAGGDGGTGGNYPGGNGGAGVDLATGKLINRGTIRGGNGGSSYGSTGGDGVDVGSGAVLVNKGTITGGHGQYPLGFNGAGVAIDGGTLTNFGTINGGTSDQSIPAGDAVQFGSLAGTLIIDPGAAFNGLVVADPAVADTLRLAGDGGTLTGLGTEYTGFTTIGENPGTTWTLDGSNTLTAGTTLRDAGTFTVTGPLSGAGTVLLRSGGDLRILSSLDVGHAEFAPSADATLSVAAGATVSVTISGFGTGDIIDIGEVANTLTYLGGTLTLENGSTAVATFTLSGHYKAADFHLQSDMHGGTDISFVPSSAADLTTAAATPSEAPASRAASAFPTPALWLDLLPTTNAHAG